MFLCISCGNSNDFQNQKIISAQSSVLFNHSISEIQTLKVTQYVIQISGCSSGYTATITINSAAQLLSLYDKDSNCTAALVSFEFENSNWTPSAGGPFSGNTPALFKNNINSNRIMVRQIQNLTSPVTSNQKIIFSFYNAALQSENIQLINIKQSQFLPNSVDDAPNLKPSAAAPVDIQSISNNGIATFFFKVTCSILVVSPFRSCISEPRKFLQRMDRMKALILNDTFSGVLTWDQANNLVYDAQNNPRPGVINIDRTNLRVPTAGDNGGFGIALSTPQALNQNPQMLLIIASKTGYSVFKFKISGETVLSP